MPMTHRIDVRKGTWESISCGLKPLLVHIDDRIFTRFSEGDTVRIHSGSSHKICTCELLAMRRYKSLDELLEKEDLTKIAHGGHNEARNYLLQIYKRLPEHYIFVVLEIKLLSVGRKKISTG